MKLRKVLSLIVAVAMIGTLALAVNAAPPFTSDKTATFTLKLEGGEGWGDNQFHVAGGSVEPESNAINYELIRGVRFTFNLTETNPDEETGEIPVAIAYNTGPTKWKQEDFNYAEKKSVTVDLSANAWNPETEKGIDWLEIAVASWAEGNNGTVLVEILGENNVVLKLGQQELANAPSTTAAPSTGGAGTGTPSTGGGGVGGGGEGSKIDTGIGGVAVIGAVAILAIGAIGITRKRK